MLCTPEMVKFEDNGKEIYFKVSKCPLVQHWATKYRAKRMVEEIPKGGGCPLLHELGWEPIGFLDGSPRGEKGDTVWVVPSSTMGASHDANLIRRLLSATNAKDYKDIRRNLSEAEYPGHVFDAAPSPR